MAFQRHPRLVLSRLQSEVPELVKASALGLLGPDHPEMAAELTGVYLPLAVLIQQRLAARKTAQAHAAAALGAAPGAAPFIIGLAGGVAVGKSTSAKLLQTALAAWPEHPDVALVSSDGFLFPNAELEQRGLMERKGFPESFDSARLIDFLTRLKSGESGITAPLYSHTVYDVMRSPGQMIHNPHIVIVEGINVLQPHPADADSDHSLASDFFDFSIYVHADEILMRRWFTERFMALTEAAVNDAQSFYARFAALSAEQRLAVADFVWTTINGKNLNNHILPTRPRADLVLHKGPDHTVTHIELRSH